MTELEKKRLEAAYAMGRISEYLLMVNVYDADGHEEEMKKHLDVINSFIFLGADYFKANINLSRGVLDSLADEIIPKETRGD